MEKEEAENERFYGPASNCDEQGKLGYTLNGYYLVKGKDESLGNSIEAVLCRFKLPEESKGGKNLWNCGYKILDNDNICSIWKYQIQIIE